MGSSGTLKIYSALNFLHSALGAVQGTATVTPLSTGENNSTGVSRYRVISLSCFVCSRTHFTVKRVSATGDEIEKSIARTAIARGHRHCIGKANENVAYRLFTRRVFVVSDTFTR